MNQEILQKILEIYDIALTDKEYLQLYSDYAPAQEKLRELLEQLTAEQRKSLEDYLEISSKLHHRLMALALERNR